MLALGPTTGSQVIVFAPFFEEMNFTRAFVLDIARALARDGIGSWLPDLPGTGESLRPLREIGWQDWRDAARAAAEMVEQESGSRPHVVSIRGGALLADAIESRSWWSYTPTPGASLLRQLERIKLISDRKNIDQDAHGIYEYSGYELNAAMHEGLKAATVRTPAAPYRTAPAEFAGSRVPLWHRAEPARDPELAAALGADLVQWVRACESR